MEFDPPPPILPDIVSHQAMQQDVTCLDTATAVVTPTQAIQHQPPPLPPPRQHQQPMPLQMHSQLPDMVPEKVVEEFEKIMRNENDNVVLTNSICLLFRFSIDGVRGHEVCRALSNSSEIITRLYYVLTDDQFNCDDLILCYATGNLTNISKYEEGRAAILGCNNNYKQSHRYEPSEGVQALFKSLQSRYGNVVIFAITAIHNLLLDRRFNIQDMSKEQIKHGIRYFVQLLDNKCLIENYEFKVIVLDCLQILAYGNNENRIAIRESGGAYLILKNINENLDNQATELIETASRLLKSLSACKENKRDIIEYDGIVTLTECIKKNNLQILQTCLWTLRNLSDLINDSSFNTEIFLNSLVARLLQILEEYLEEPSITACALGILANITCNNNSIKRFICEHSGVNIIINTIFVAAKDAGDFNLIDHEIVEPAIGALCHLLNQADNQEIRKIIIQYANLFEYLRGIRISSDLSKALDKLINLTRI